MSPPDMRDPRRLSNAEGPDRITTADDEYQSGTGGRRPFWSAVAAERARLQAEKERRRALVLAYPDLAARLTRVEFMPYPYSDPKMWDGYVPEPYDHHVGVIHDDGTKSMTTQRVETGQRLALLHLIAEAERRESEVVSS